MTCLLLHNNWNLGSFLLSFFSFFFCYARNIFKSSYCSYNTKRRQLHYWRLFAACKALRTVAIQLLQHFEVLLLRARSFAKISIYYRLSTVLIRNSFNQECSLFPWLKSTLSSFLCSCRFVCWVFLILFIISLFSGFSLGLFCFTMQTCLNLLRWSFFIHGLY